MENTAAAVKLIAWPGWGVVGATAALTVILAAVLALLLPFPSKPLAAQLNDHGDRMDLRARLGLSSPGVAYAVAIRRFNAWCDAWFGAPLSSQAFERCLAIAFVYPVSIFLLSLVISGVSSGKADIQELLIFLFASAASGVLAFLFLRLFVRFIQRLFGMMGGDAEIAAVFAKIALSGFAVITAFGIAFVIASVTSTEFSGIGSVALATLMAFAIAFALAVIYIFAGGIAFAIALAGVAGLVFTLASEFAFVLLLFFVMIPIANAGIDWLSWACVRSLSMASQQPGWRGAALSVGAMAVAALAAAVLALCLAILLANGLEAVNALFSFTGHRGFNWRAIADRAVQAPWTEGLLLTAMILTPFAPLFFQMTMGAAGMFARVTPGATQAAAIITEHPDVTMTPEEIARVSRVARLSRFCYAPSALLAAVIFVVAGWALHISGARVSVFVADLAVCSTIWRHGQCPLL